MVATLKSSGYGEQQERRMTLRFCLILSIFILTAPVWGQTEADEWFKQGMALYQEDNFSESMQAYQKVLDIRPLDAEAWNNMGIDLGMLGRYDDAIEAFEKAISINQLYAEAWFNKGVIYDLQSNYPMAIQAYDRAIQINPSYEKAIDQKYRDIEMVNSYQLGCGYNCIDQDIP
jgi:tetratricopeptide (TPR) repeat protein